MIVKINDYRNDYDFIKHMYANRGNRTLSELCAEVAPVIHVPCVAVAHFLLEIHGESEELRDIINRLIQFYGYSKIEV